MQTATVAGARGLEARQGAARRSPAAASPGDGAPGREAIVRAVREGYAGHAWHGPSVRQALAGVTAAQARWRPAAGRNTIWELVLHLAYTRHRVLRRMGDAGAARFPRARRAAWFPVMPDEPTEAAWRADLALLDGYQARFLDAVRRAPAGRLRRVRPGQRRTIAHELLGVALHDCYHAGQIRLLARLSATWVGA